MDPGRSADPPLLSAAPVPEPLVELVATSPVSRLVTVTGSGTPIVDALLHGPDPTGTAIDYGTGLAYPAKAERARTHPAVGLLFLGPEAAGSPIGIVAAHAAVRDRDLQENTDRWVRQYRDGWLPPGVLDLPWWEAVWYFVRVYIACTPVAAWWWPGGDLAGEPATWVRSSSTSLPASDPAPAGPPSRAPAADRPPWEAVADGLDHDQLALPVLAAAADGGHPLPVPTRGFERIPEGYRVRLPASLPWRPEGRACLSFEAPHANPPGVGAGFVGRSEVEGDWCRITVERALPANPRARDHGTEPGSHLFPPPEVRGPLVERLHHELARRRAPMPVVRGLADPR